jgi:uncharacterized protein YpmS
VERGNTMPFWKWLIFIIFIVVVIGLLLFLYAGLKISSKCSREEEGRNAYTNTRNDFKK